MGAASRPTSATLRSEPAPRRSRTQLDLDTRRTKPVEPSSVLRMRIERACNEPRDHRAPSTASTHGGVCPCGSTAPGSRTSSRPAPPPLPPRARLPRRAARPSARATPRRRPRRRARRPRRPPGSDASCRAHARRARAPAPASGDRLGKAPVGPGDVLLAEDAGPRDEQVGTGLTDLGRVVGADTTVHLHVDAIGQQFP